MARNTVGATMNLREAARAALELIERQCQITSVWSLEQAEECAKNLRAALAAPQPEFDAGLTNPEKTRSDQTPQPEPVNRPTDSELLMVAGLCTSIMAHGSEDEPLEYWSAHSLTGECYRATTLRELLAEIYRCEHTDDSDRPLAAPQPPATSEPVAWMAPETGQVYRDGDITDPQSWATPLYAHPPRSYTPMTDEEIQASLVRFGWTPEMIGEYTNRKQVSFARAIEREVCRRLNVEVK